MENSVNGRRIQYNGKQCKQKTKKLNFAKLEIKNFAKLQKQKFRSHPTPTQSADCYSPSPPVC